MGKKTVSEGFKKKGKLASEVLTRGGKVDSQN
jgi:hypothetical protein